MVRYREILRLTSMGTGMRNVAFSVGCATSTVQDVLRAARAVGLEWPPSEAKHTLLGAGCLRRSFGTARHGRSKCRARSMGLARS